MTKGKPITFDDYLATLSDDKRAVLEKLRQVIRAAAPKAEEGISYGVAAFRLDGKPLAGLGANANHCAYYPMSGSVVATLKADLLKYDTSKGSIRFPVDKPLSAALVRKLVKARSAEIVEQTEKTRAPGTRRKANNTQTDPAVIAFLEELDHPLKKEIEAVRQIILDVSSEIREGIKWNAPSFRTTEFFATLNLRQGRIWLILHLGAKVKDNSTVRLKIADPTGLLEWLAKDRCVVKFDNAADVKDKRKTLTAIVRKWIQFV